jgi:putative membrane protein
MTRWVLRWLINAAALYVAVGTGWLPGIRAVNTSGWTILALAVLFSIVNGLLRPILKLLTCPLILLTLGLFMLVINTFLFWFTGWLGNQIGSGFGYSVDTIWAALLGSVVVSLVNGALTVMFREELKAERE